MWEPVISNVHLVIPYKQEDVSPSVKLEVNGYLYLIYQHSNSAVNSGRKEKVNLLP